MESQVASRRKQGQATVEFAIVLSLLVVLLVGVADVARIFSEHLSAVHAAGVGARWLTLDVDNRDCSNYASLDDVVRADLQDSIPWSNVQTPVGYSIISDPPSVRVAVTYTHSYLFGLLTWLPGQFTGAATMPGNFVGGPGVCPTIPVPVATNTPLVAPTVTPQPPTPTNTSVIPTNTPGPTATATCVPHSYLNGAACRTPGGGSQPWQASVTIVGYRAGDSVFVTLCNSSGNGCGTLRSMNCDALGNCTYSTAAAEAGSNQTVRFSITAGPGSCSLGQSPPIPLSNCAGPTNTPTSTSTNTPTAALPTNTPTVTAPATSTNTPTITPTATNTATATVTPTVTATSTVTVTPTPGLQILQITARKDNGNGKPVAVRVYVTDGIVGQSGVSLSGTAGGVALPGNWVADTPTGWYYLCSPPTVYDGNGITVVVNASKTGYQPTTASTTAATGYACPPP